METNWLIIKYYGHNDYELMVIDDCPIKVVSLW